MGEVGELHVNLKSCIGDDNYRFILLQLWLQQPIQVSLTSSILLFKFRYQKRYTQIVEMIEEHNRILQ